MWKCLIQKETDLLQIGKGMKVLHCIHRLGECEKEICDEVHNTVKLHKETGIQAGVQGG